MNKKYCVWCGSEVSENAKFCTKCGKLPAPEENMLQDWLISHTKENLKEKAEDNLVSAIKNWALSNLYSMILGITIVSAAAAVVTNSNTSGHIQQMDTPPQAVIEMMSPEEESNTEEYRFTIDEINELDLFIYDYEQYMLTNRNNLSGWPEEFWLVPAMSGDAVHGLHRDFDNNIYHVKEHLSDMFLYPLSYTTEPVSEIGRSLKDQGFKIAVTERCLYMYIAEEYLDDYPADVNERAAQAYYTLTLVHINGEWRIAEEFESMKL